MTAKRKPYRGRRGTKQLDLTDMKKALRDGRQWTALGIVVAPPDGSAHWKIVGDNIDVMVEVELQPSQEPVTARLAAGIWMVPDVGDEVAVMLPAGELDFMPTITCVLASSVPATQGPQPQRILIVRGEVLVHNGSGGAEPLVRKSEFDGHTHPPGSFNAPSGGGPVTGDSGGAAAVDGTSVLKAR